MATLAEVLRQAGYVTPQGQVVGPRTDLAQKLKSYVMNIPQNAAQNLANQRADIDAALTMGQGGIQIGDREAFARQMAEVPNLMGLTAYHGTPHTIKGKFDISKVGTGEGAQAYGHGMYFAENPAVAKQYQAALSNPKYKVGERELKGNEAWAAQFLHSFQDDALPKRIDVNTAINKANETLKDTATKQEIINNIKALDKSGLTVESGNLYKVDIPDADIPKMVTFETPLSDMDEKLSAVIKPLQEQLKNQPNPDLFKNAKSVGDVIQYSHAIGLKPHIPLQEAGFTGIRYLDEGSRNAQQRWIARHPKGGESDFPTLEQAQAFINKYPNDKYTLIEPKPLTSNFVVFDPSEVKILEQNSKPMTRKEIIEQELEKIAK